MRSYSNFLQSIGRLLVQISQQSLSFCQQACHPWTRTYVRLLGPCFKTGRRKPFRLHELPEYRRNHYKIIPQVRQKLLCFTWVWSSTFMYPQVYFHVLDVFLKQKQMLTHKARNTIRCTLVNSLVCLRCTNAISYCRTAILTKLLVPFASLSAISGTF